MEVEQNIKKNTSNELKEKDSDIISYPISKEEQKKSSVSFFKLEYSLANKIDIMLISFACLGSLIAGAAMPLISLLLGKVLNQFNGKIEEEKVPDLVQGLIVNFLLAGIAIFLGSKMMVFFWSLVGRRLINKINEDYFKVIMKQEQAWFDQSNMYEFATKVQIQIKTIENGIGNKVGQALMSISQFIVSFLVGYITSWKLSLVLTSMLPLLGLGGWCMSKAMEQGSSNRRTYEKAGGMAEEVLYQIKTVASFANYEYEASKYQAYLSDSLEAGIKSGFKTGFGIGFIVFVVYCSYSLAVGYGTKLISNQDVNSNSGYVFGAGDVITVLFSIIFGCFSLGQGAPNIKAIYEATSAAIEYFELKERKPKSDNDEEKEKPPKENLIGKLTLDKISFAYPSKPDHMVLDNLNIEFEAGKKFAIVGQSGSGKSTILSLIERFYEPNVGNMLFDNININSIDLKYWRSLIGYVPQEPVLFNTTIKHNIIFGRDIDDENEIEEACEKAYAKEFIDRIGLDYIVGIKGSKLSGGQKQRIAIARAILKKPKLLILDEATSALDNKSEKEVQKALDIVSKGITTIIIAHKIETIKNSDCIFFLDDGKIVETGTHKELIAKGGLYANMIETEREKKKKEEIEQKENEDENNKNDEEEFEDSKNHSIIRGHSEFLPHYNVAEQVNGKVEEIEIKENLSQKLSPKKKYTSLKESSRKNTNQNLYNNQIIIETQQNGTNSTLKENKEKLDSEYLSTSKKRLLALLKDHKCFVAGGMIAAACNGAVWPIYGILLADAIGVLSLPDMSDVYQGGLNVSMMFLGLAIAAAIILWMQNYFFYGIGEILTKKFREKIFDKFLNFHIGFFDRAENSPGSLLTKLSSDTTKVNGIALTIIGQLIQTAVTLILGITLAMVYQWKLCLLNLCFMPLIIGNYIIQFRVQKGSAEGNENIEVEAGSTLSESVINTKTIFSYNMEDKVVEFYSKILKGFHKSIYKTSLLNGLLYGVSQFVIFGMYATLFYVGGNLYSENEVTLQNMMRAIFTILFSALGVGIAQAFVGDYQAAKYAIVSLYKIIDEPSLIDVAETEIKGIKKANYEGKIEFKNVKFSYPNRPNNLIFNNLNFTIQPGQNVAFVGSSGSGKSTIISLIERFYDVIEGQVLIDDINIKDYDLKQLRKNIGLVMQEPVLFKRTIRENIKYGRLDATEEEVLQAAKDAYIDSLLEESENKDVPISGGQKQRVAIARAILKNPSILLLDEATSALDSRSEDLVKDSLNKLMTNRTSIVIAHRLSTIIHCSMIFVLENGIIIENGTHSQLMELQGKYYNLYTSSNN